MQEPVFASQMKRRLREGAGLIVRRIEGTKRPCRLAPDAIAQIDQWLATLRTALTANYDRLDNVLAESERSTHAQTDA